MEPLLDRLAGQKPVRVFFETIRTSRAKRFIGVMLCSVIVPFVVAFSGILFTDWDRSSLYGDACYIIFMIAEWPVFLGAILFEPRDPPTFMWVLLFAITGLFWAGMADLFFVWRKRHAA